MTAAYPPLPAPSSASWRRWTAEPLRTSFASSAGTWEPSPVEVTVKPAASASADLVTAYQRAAELANDPLPTRQYAGLRELEQLWNADDRLAGNAVTWLVLYLRTARTPEVEGYARMLLAACQRAAERRPA